MMNGTNSMGDGIGWSMGFGGFSMLIFWGLVIFAVFAVIKWLLGSNENNTPSTNSSPEDILKQRYARGEIDEQEFQQKQRDLKQ